MILLDHVGVKVTDLDRAVEFYTSLFGFPVFERRRFDSGIDAAGLRVGDSVMFLLYHPSHRAHDPGDVVGIDHFCLTFDAAQWEEVVTRIRARGLKLLEGEEPLERGGATGKGLSLYIADPDGNKIEVKK